MKRIVFLDLDGTLCKGYLSLQFLRYLTEQGIFDEEEYARQMQYVEDLKAGKMTFGEWVHTITGWGTGLSGKSGAVVREHALRFFEKFKGNIYGSSYELITLLRDSGFEPVLVSAGVHEVVSLAAEALGIQHVMSTVLEIDRKGIYTGKVLSNIHLPEGKMESVQELLRKRGVDFRQCAGLGDSPHDEPLLASVGFPIALNANEGMERIAKERGWPSLTHENVLEYVQKWMDATR